VVEDDDDDALRACCLPNFSGCLFFWLVDNMTPNGTYKARMTNDASLSKNSVRTKNRRSDFLYSRLAETEMDKIMMFGSDGW
jgi:hypothetical protein